MQSRFLVEFEDIKLLIDTPNNTIQGFVVNLDCEIFEGIFNGGDQSIIFRDNNLWLFIDDNIDLDEIDARVSTDFQKIVPEMQTNKSKKKMHQFNSATNVVIFRVFFYSTDLIRLLLTKI